MIARAFWLMGLAMVCGCGSRTPVAVDDTPYPVRSDWLVVNTPSGSGQPSKWYQPGYPPLVMLNQPFDTLKGDDALLANQARSRVILNTGKVEPDLRDEFGKVLTELYGTPAEPKVPSGDVLLKQLKLGDKLEDLRKDLEGKKKNLRDYRATAKLPADQPVLDLFVKQVDDGAGAVDDMEKWIAGLKTFEHDLLLDPQTLKTGGELFRNYCQQCHGLTGDGNGPGGRYLIPLPRDYRQGLFKFTTSHYSVGSKRKPLREDLYRTITRGMDGSPMPQFGALKQDEVNAIISYVIHLSMRGEAEYEVMKKAADPGADEMGREDIRKGLFNQAGSIVNLWMKSRRNAIEPEPDPYDTDDKKLEAAARGHKLFTSASLGCTQCHTNYGRTAPYQFDAWGSIVRPRNLTVATLRGGRTPEAIYSRIHSGIPGSNMPSYAVHPDLQQNINERGANKLWDLVHFVLYVSEADKRQLLKDKFQIEIEP